MSLIADEKDLLALYGEPGEASIVKEVDHVHPVYRPFIEAAPFCVLATSGPGGLDASPRGDGPGFVVIEDANTLLIPDRRGNNRVDSLRNVIADPRVALLFLIPGIGETIRVNGRASLSVDPVLKARFAIDGKEPRSILVIAVERVYFQCSRAVVRADLWNPAAQVARAALPSAGKILAAVSESRVGGDDYDRGLADRVKATLY
ncbi:MAG: flavin-nucleotide-binding protein [Rhodospirillales bacterium]|nr:flavin-nucleotide-binding protein [Rhodospirillales bacterium]